MENKLATFRRLLRLHGSWLLYKLLGKDVLSKEELTELRDYGKLPVDGDEVDLIGQAFSLGRASALEKKKTYEGITLESLSRVQKYRHRDADKLAVREAKLHAATSIQKSLDRVSTKAYEKMASSATDMLDRAILSDAISDEVALGVKEKKTRQELAASISERIHADLTFEVNRIAVTELHRAKQRGVAMAIANKVDIYKKGNGIKSQVSVVPDRSACDDCKKLYVGKDGNPKVFTLEELLSHGTNEGRDSKRLPGGGRKGWKPVLPPNHPHCFCELVYLPAGRYWKQGKLVSDVKKAVDKGSLAPTITPKGPMKNQGPKIPKPPNIPGLASPSQAGGGGGGMPQMPQMPNAQQDGGGNKSGTIDCPYGGGEACFEADGDGAMTHEVGGGQMQAHLEHEKSQGKEGPAAKAMAELGQPVDFQADVSTRVSGQAGGSESQRPTEMPGSGEEQKQESKEQNPQEKMAQYQEINDWKLSEHSDEEAHEHMLSSRVVYEQDISDAGGDEGVTQDVKKVGLEGNGPALAKGGLGNDPLYEQHAKSMANTLGTGAHYPATACRVSNKGRRKSFQAWLSKHIPFTKVTKMLTGTTTTPDKLRLKAMFDASADGGKLDAGLTNMTATDIVQCNTDRHHGNFMLNSDFTDVQAIDNGGCFGVGLHLFRSNPMEMYKASGRKMVVPEKVRTRMANTSLRQIQDSMSVSMDWQSGQSYMRMQYMLHCHEQDGHLDPKRFLSSSGLNRQSAPEQFEDFMIDWLDERTSDPDHPDHQTAKKLEKMGLFMDGFVCGERDHRDQKFIPVSNYRKGNQQCAHEKFARSQKAALEMKKAGQDTSWWDKRQAAIDEELDAWTQEHWTPFEEEFQVDVDQAETVAATFQNRVEDMKKSVNKAIQRGESEEQIEHLRTMHKALEKEYEDVHLADYHKKYRMAQVIRTDHEQQRALLRTQWSQDLRPPGMESKYDEIDRRYLGKVGEEGYGMRLLREKKIDRLNRNKNAKAG